jgi:endoglucanase
VATPEAEPSPAFSPIVSPSGAVRPAAASSPAGPSPAEPSPAIRLDQVGYPAAAPKLALIAVEPPADRFTVHRLPGGAVVLAGEPGPVAFDPDSGDRVQAADFSAFAEPGRYELRVPGAARSAPFGIAPDPYRGLLRLALRSYYGQRCGTAVDLGPESPGYRHPPCHLEAAFHRSSGRRGGRPATGGWHDAGDYGRYVVNSGISTGTLLWSFELYGQRLADLDLGIPESGYGTPDVLDEIRWNLEWMLSMQDTDGGVWHKQTSKRFPGFVPPHRDRSIGLVIGTGSAPYKSSCATADLAAVAAIAGRLYRPHDRAFADRSLAAARRAWGWLGEYPNVTFRNPRGVSTGEYGDADCTDERLWAAAELWRTTGDPEAGAYFVGHAGQVLAAIGPAGPPSWSEVGALAAWSYALAGTGDPATVAAIRSRSLEAAAGIAARAGRHPYRIPMAERDWVWGSNSVAANYGLQLLVAREWAAEADRSLLEEAAFDVLHYLLGRNPFSVSWVTGAGTRSVRQPHHRPSGSDGIATPWPGLLAGGPNRNRQDPVLRALPPGTPPARMYADEVESYASNEVAINWNAPLVFLLAGVPVPE